MSFHVGPQGTQHIGCDKAAVSLMKIIFTRNSYLFDVEQFESKKLKQETPKINIFSENNFTKARTVGHKNDHSKRPKLRRMPQD